MELYIDTNKKVIKKNERLILTLAKDKNCLTAAVADVVMYTCPNCGDTINLLNGGMCNSCGYKIDLRQFDWIILNYKYFNTIETN